MATWTQTDPNLRNSAPSRPESEARRDIRRLSEFLDSKFQLPFGWKIGWDGILGLIPVYGDLATNGLSFYILYKAAVIGCPPSVILRMALNVVIDNVVDMLPLIGNIFDFMFKSNLKNARLLEEYLDRPHQTLRSSRWVVALTVLFMLGLMIGSMILAYVVARWLWGLIQPGW